MQAFHFRCERRFVLRRHRSILSAFAFALTSILTDINICKCFNSCGSSTAASAAINRSTSYNSCACGASAATILSAASATTSTAAHLTTASTPISTATPSSRSSSSQHQFDHEDYHTLMLDEEGQFRCRRRSGVNRKRKFSESFSNRCNS